MHRRAFSIGLLACLAIWGAGCGSSDGNVAGSGADSLASRDAFEPDATGNVRVIVQFQPVTRAARANAVQAVGGQVADNYEIIPGVAATVPAAAIEALRRNPDVVVVEPDVEVRINDAEMDKVWGVRKIRADLVQSGGNSGAGVKVAVLDTGIDYNHPDLNDNYAGGYDFVNRDGDPMDDHGHGTHVAGTIGAEDNDLGVVGVAPGVKLYACKVLSASGSGTTSSIIAALDWCVASGIKVTNHSYGAPINLGSTCQAAFDRAAAAGMIHCAAAGNSGTAAGDTDSIEWPARYTSVIAVCATGSTDVRASWSSTGPLAELSAPGSGIYSTTRGGGYGNKSGTSMASPHAAGAVALCLAAGLANPRGALQSTAVDLGTSGRDNQYGYGRIDAATAVQQGGGGGGDTGGDPGNGGEVEPPPPPAETGTLRGKIYDRRTKVGIAGATVKLDTGQIGLADAGGWYRIDNAPSGKRTVVISAAGYQSYTRTVTIKTGQTTRSDTGLVR